MSCCVQHPDDRYRRDVVDIPVDVVGTVVLLCLLLLLLLLLLLPAIPPVLAVVTVLAVAVEVTVLLLFVVIPIVLEVFVLLFAFGAFPRRESGTLACDAGSDAVDGNIGRFVSKFWWWLLL